MKIHVCLTVIETKPAGCRSSRPAVVRKTIIFIFPFSRRSMSEMTVDFRRPDVPDNYSDVSSVYNYNYMQQHQLPHHGQPQHSRRGSSYYADDDAGSLVRSLSQPSLARSASEFTENNWGLRIRSYEDGDDLSSPDHTPRSSFRSRRSGGGDGLSAADVGDGLQHRNRLQHHQQQQQYSEYSSSGHAMTTTADRTAGGSANASRRMFGGRTVSAAEWFHDSDENDAAYK